MKADPRLHLLAASPKAGHDTIHIRGALTLEAAATAGKLPALTIHAYNGGPLLVGEWTFPVVVDLAGMQSRDPVKVLKDHNRGDPVGHCEAVTIGADTVDVKGVVSCAGPSAQEVLAGARNGFPWEASIGTKLADVEFCPSGLVIAANGRTFSGPVNVARRSLLVEVSICSLGADSEGTSVKLAATAAPNGTAPAVQGDKAMDFNAWLKAKGVEVATLTAEKKAELEAQFKAETAKPVPAPLATPAAVPADLEARARQYADDAVRAERLRVAQIEAAVEPPAGGWGADAVKVADLRAKAVKAEITVDGLKDGVVSILRAARPQAPNAIIRSSTAPGRDVLEAALAMSARLPGVEKMYNAEALEAARKEWRHGVSIQELLLEAAWRGGYTGRHFRGNEDEVLHAAFSTLEVGIGDILSNVANKFLLDGYNSVEPAWRQVARILPVKDFKTQTRYRLTGDMAFEQVAPDGDLKHGKVGQESYTINADTFGKMFVIPRTDIINDDLGCFGTMRQRIGRGGALKLNTAFWTAWLANGAGTFWTAARGNYVASAATALSITGFTAVELLFLNLKDADGNPMAQSPAVILVPNALKVTAELIMGSLGVNEAATAAAPQPSANPHRGKARVVSSSYLGTAGITGYSITGWYLLADPQTSAAAEVAFLNGVESPTVQSSEADFNVLGIQFRGFFDFGVALADYRAGVFSKGAA